jgi:hypothetical protein
MGPMDRNGSFDFSAVTKMSILLRSASFSEKCQLFKQTSHPAQKISCRRAIRDLRLLVPFLYPVTTWNAPCNT